MASMTTLAQLTGLLLVGHGTRSEIGVRQFLAVAARLREKLSPQPVEPAFLELAEPDIDAAVGRLVEQGIQRLVTMPLLLFAAGHAKEDVPRAVKSALARRGMEQIEQVQAAHLGCNPALVELSNLRMREALAVGAHRGRASGKCVSREDPGTENLCLLLVGRGSRDETATAQMHEFARLRQRAAGFRTEVAFLAMALPSLQEQLTLLAGQGAGQVIVQPHLLFHGDLVDLVERQVAEVAAGHPESDWIVTPPLADPPGTVSVAADLIEKVILDRVRSASIHVVARGGDD
jgi:sirohydrochlorin cobaltochelatase